MDIFWLLISNLVVLAIILMLVKFFIFYDLAWLRIVQQTKFFVDNYYGKFTLLEIKIPKEVTRSPQAMEFVIDVLHQKAEGQKIPKIWDILKKKKSVDGGLMGVSEKFRAFWSDRYLKGEKRMWFSLEIESRGGELHFYISCQAKYKEIIKSALYSQYPGIEVSEAEDYTNKIRHWTHGGKHDVWNAYLKEESTKAYLPIKTYVDYGLDKDPKDEHKVDPLVAQLEAITNIKPDEHIWITYVIHSDVEEEWVKDGKDRIDKIMGIKRYSEMDIENYKEEHGNKSKPDFSVGDIKEQNKDVTKLPPKEKNEVDAIYRMINKNGFQVVMYASYFALKGKIRGEADQIIRNLMKPFNNISFSTYKMQNHNSTQPWHEVDFANPKRQNRRRAGWTYLQITRNPLYFETSADPNPLQTLISRFRDYGFTEGMKNYYDDFLVYFNPIEKAEESAGFTQLNVEELATLFHIPSNAFNAQKNIRVESTKAEPPVNLPI